LLLTDFVMNTVVNFENFDKKLKELVSTQQWEKLQTIFNDKKIIILFGHGGNLGVTDHGAIDIGRLTDKTALCPGSGIMITSLVSDFNFETWIQNWLEMVLRGIDTKDVLVIGTSCSLGTPSSNSIVNALNYAVEQGCEGALMTARDKTGILNEKVVKIINNSIYYHTSECITLMLIYQLIYGYSNSNLDLDLVSCPPPIRVRGTAENVVLDKGCSNCEGGALDHSWCLEALAKENKQVPPGCENDEDNLAIDFDGVIHTFDKGFYDGTCYGEPIEGAIESIKKLSEKYNIIIFSGKCLPDRPLVYGKTGKDLIIDWLKKYELLAYVKDVTHIKPRAKYYIDDKGITFDNNWNEICEKLL